MSGPDLVIRGQRVVTPEAIGPASMHIRNGIITAIGSPDEVPPGCPIVDAGNSVVSPALIDTHVHINEPGRTDWEGFHSATHAAAAGGVTTLVDMPLNSIPATTTLNGLEAKREAAQGQCWVDVGLWGGLVPGNASQLRPLFDAGVFGFKCFLVPSGVEEFPHVTEADLRVGMAELAALNAALLAHAELPGPMEGAAGKNACPTTYSRWLGSRPREAENEAIALLIRLSRELGSRVHIVHLSSADALPLLRRAKEEGLPITVETCPHYLCFAAEEIRDGATEFKCAPPIRECENREQLWAALGEGLIDLVASDHSPCPPELKCGDSGDFLRAWGGISSLQLSLSVMWTQAQRRGYSIRRLAEWMSTGPARLAGLEQRKGAIRAGYDADLVVWNPEGTFRVGSSAGPDSHENGQECPASHLHHRHKLTPYAGRLLRGVVEATFLRGKKIYENGHFPSGPSGRMLQRGA